MPLIVYIWSIYLENNFCTWVSGEYKRNRWQCAGHVCVISMGIFILPFCHFKGLERGFTFPSIQVQSEFLKY